MGKSIDPVQRLIDWLKRLDRRLKALETAPTLQNTSVTKGRLRFIGGLLLIDSGGTLQVIGTFDGNGDFTWSGPWKFDSGDGEIAGNVDITGNATVNGGGKIRVEGGDSPATIEDGKFSFDTGGELEADVDNGGARLRKGDAVVNVGDVASIRKGSTSVIVGPLGITLNAPSGQRIRLQGGTEIASLTSPPPGAVTTPLVVDVATGQIYRGS